MNELPRVTSTFFSEIAQVDSYPIKYNVRGVKSSVHLTFKGLATLGPGRILDPKSKVKVEKSSASYTSRTAEVSRVHEISS
jgi:hypothetical protein